MAENYESLVINRATQTDTQSEKNSSSESADSRSHQNSNYSSNSNFSRPNLGSTAPHINYDQKPMMNQKKSSSKIASWWYVLPVVLFLGAFGASYAWMFGGTTPPKITEVAQVEEEKGSLLDITGEPKDQACPLNGKMFTATEKTSWETRRPMAVMIENTPDARPQSGLSRADVIYEAVAEGGITRFMALFYCAVQVDDTTLAPIRSARTYFINLASGYNWPLYVHVGGANVEGKTNALGQLSDYGWTGENDINQFSVGYPTFYRDYNRIADRDLATEHTMVTTTEGIWEVAKKRGWTNLSPEMKIGKTTLPAENWKDSYTGWTFVDGSATSTPSASNISYQFWSGYNTYNATWKYDATTNTYKRYQGSGSDIVALTDLDTEGQVAVSDVVVMFAEETGPINEQKHMLYDVIGSGNAQIFKNGQVYKATWKKATREGELNFFGENGKPFEFNRGQIWVSVVPDTNKVDYN